MMFPGKPLKKKRSRNEENAAFFRQKGGALLPFVFETPSSNPILVVFLEEPPSGCCDVMRARCTRSTNDEMMDGILSNWKGDTFFLSFFPPAKSALIYCYYYGRCCCVLVEAKRDDDDFDDDARPSQQHQQQQNVLLFAGSSLFFSFLD